MFLKQLTTPHRVSSRIHDKTGAKNDRLDGSLLAAADASRRVETWPRDPGSWSVQRRITRSKHGAEASGPSAMSSFGVVARKVCDLCVSELILPRGSRTYRGSGSFAGLVRFSVGAVDVSGTNGRLCDRFRCVRRCTRDSLLSKTTRYPLRPTSGRPRGVPVGPVPRWSRAKPGGSSPAQDQCVRRVLGPESVRHSGDVHPGRVCRCANDPRSHPRTARDPGRDPGPRVRHRADRCLGLAPSRP